MPHVSNWEKFKLLSWKNWLLQWHHKKQFVIEILVPVAFSLIFVLLRIVFVPQPKSITMYEPQHIDNIDLFRQKMSVMEFAKPVSYELQYSPENSYLENIVRKAVDQLGLAGYKGHADAAALGSAMFENNNYLAGIQFDDEWANITTYPTNFAFALSYPSELRTSTSDDELLSWLTMRLFPLLDLGGPRNPTDQDGGMPVGYLRESFLPVQHAISMAYIALVSNRTNLPYVDMQRYPFPAYTSDPLLLLIASLLPLIIVLSFIYPCSIIVQNITVEKEKQLKEVMKIMGLNNCIHWTAWFVKSFVMLTISAILITIILKMDRYHNVAILTYANWSVLLFFMLIYVITSICFCFMIATFFTRANTAAPVTGFIWYMSLLPFSLLYPIYVDLSLGTKLGLCLIANTAMGFGFKLIMLFEGSGEGIQWSNLFTPVNISDDLTLGYIIIMMLVSCVIYITICLYVEQIFPGEFGVPRKWNFIFSPKFWCGKRNYIGVEEMRHDHIERPNPDAFEPEPAGKHIGLQVKNLQKRFGDKVAVKDVSINMYKDEITVLLGHNGAGKTTTICMLTGMFPPTSGTAIMNGSDIRTNIEGARMSLGICPQHNVLFDDLSVAEHLIFFSRLKGLSGNAVKQEVDKYIRMIQLEHKADVASSKLSGGMKRKLSICCALTGNAKVVLCDEPSSGLDPSARRQLWDLLQAEKIGRTVLLTTHFMDEADVLGDRIAIMCDGELKCHGTSFFLKKKFGSGYKLICVKRDGCKANDLTAFLQKYVPHLQPDADIGAELSYQLPDRYSHVFEEMLGDLERQSDNLRLSGYGISLTSLEEVFMKIGAEDANLNGDTTKQTTARLKGGSNVNDKDVESITSDRLFSENTRQLKGVKLLKNQLDAMILKKILHTYRNKLLFLIQNLIPIYFLTMTILTARKLGQVGIKPLQPMTISLDQYPVAVTVAATAPDVVGNSLVGLAAEKYKAIATSYGSDYGLQTTGDKNFTDYILALGQKIQVRINSRYLASASFTNEKITAWLNNQPLHTAPLTVNMVHKALLRLLQGTSSNK